MNTQSLSKIDPEIFEAINEEKRRQSESLELIASENVTSQAVMEAVGSVLTNKYAEGYPGKRYYGGCECVDKVETLAIDRLRQLFGGEHFNVQPHSGTQANISVYLATLKPGDKILTMSLAHGGHLTHGHPKNMSGMLYDVVNYGVNISTGLIDYDQLESLARKEKPKLITVGASAYPRTIDFEKMGEIAKNAGALLMADVAHIAGLIATNLHPSPVPFADFVTSTTHKTLRGPRGGVIICKEKYAKAIDESVFPGNQGGPLMHVIAGKAVCFLEALAPEFSSYQKQVVENAKVLAKALQENGLNIVSGGTDNHLLLIDLRERFPDITGKQAQIILESVGITANRNMIPGDHRSPFQTSGLRLGTPAVTSRGLKTAEMTQIANWIFRTLSNANNSSELNTISSEVRSLCKNFPMEVF